MSSNSIDSPTSPYPVAARSWTQWNAGLRGFVMPGWGFTLLALLFFLFLVLLGLIVVVSATYTGPGSYSADRMLDCGWALLSLAALAWALVNLHWSTQAIRHLNPLAIYAHVAIALGCGLIVLGIHSVLLARAIGSQPIVMDHSQSGQAEVGSVATAALPEGNAEEGQKIFSTSCVTCHGPTGGGLPNLAPSLRGSAFVASADDAGVGNVIRTGRAVNHPINKSGKVMPARGGNPFLGDDKIVHLVAFIRVLQKDGASGAAVDAGADAPPPVQLARWVVPQSPAPPSGMVQLDSREDIGDAGAIEVRSDQRGQRLLRSITLGLTGIHGVFLMGVMIASSNVLCRRLLHQTLLGDRSWWGLSTIGWMIATIAWLAVFLFGFLRL
jgi:mono/diheme cytochrome c family protein